MNPLPEWLLAWLPECALVLVHYPRRHFCCGWGSWAECLCDLDCGEGQQKSHDSDSPIVVILSAVGIVVLCSLPYIHMFITLMVVAMPSG